MKRGFLIMGVLIVSLFLVIGAGCGKDKYGIGTGEEDTPGGSQPEPAASVSDTKLLIDRSFMIDGTNPPFDLITKTILQQAGKGLRVEVTSNNPISVELTSAKDCLAKAQGEEYSSLVSKIGTQVSFDYTETSAEDVTNCVAMKSQGQVETQASLKVNELTF